MDNESNVTEAKPDRGTGRRKVILAGGGAAVVVIAALVFAAFWTGVLAPLDAAAKYDGLHYVSEEETTRYVETYRAQMGYAEASDEDWAAFMATYGLTPERLRASTIYQLVANKLIEAKAGELGLEATDDEVSAMVESFKANMSLNSDDVWQQTLEAYGQTEEGVRETYRQVILRQKVMGAEVEVPTPSDDELRDFLTTYVAGSGLETTKHTYCFKRSPEEGESDLSAVKAVQGLRDAFARGTHSKEDFAALVAVNCDDETLKANSGANGWDYDSSGYGSEYREALEKLKLDEVSDVFVDADGAYTFIWVSDEYQLPTTGEEAQELDLSAMPASLKEYFSDCEAQVLWQAACEEYVSGLVTAANVTYFPCPTDVPYYVDMSLATGTTDATGEDATGEAAKEDATEGTGEDATTE